MAADRATVLILSQYFREGFETGPTQSILGMVRTLSDKYRFRVIAAAAPGEVAEEWTTAFGVDRLPLARGRLGPARLRAAINATPHDVLMLCSVFDPGFSIVPVLLRRAGTIARRPLLVAPRGEFSPGALSHGSARKLGYLRFARATGLLRDATLQATTDAEAIEIKARLPGAVRIRVTPNIRVVPPLPARPTTAPDGPLRIAFLSRIDRKKNLLFALDRLAESDLACEFRIYGPVTHPDYWAECERRIAILPAQVRVNVCGNVPQDRVLSTLASEDLFFLPTMGENFGHAIADAFIAGTPALLSDRTPWRNLHASGAGWDISLEQPEAFVAALREFAAMDGQARARLRRGARAIAERMLDSRAARTALAACLEELLAGGRPA